MEATLTLTNDAAVDSTYQQVPAPVGEVLYRDTASSLSEPRTLRLAYQQAADDDGVDRFLVQMKRVDDDADSMPQSATVHVVFSLPRKGVTNADVVLEWEKLKNLIEASISEITAGIYPTNGGG